MSKKESFTPGIRTGLKNLDRLIEGLRKDDMVLVASRPGMGKTAFAYNMARAAAAEGKKTLLFKMGMGKEEWDQNSAAVPGICVDEASVTIGEMTARCREQKAADGLDLIILGCVQMMKLERRAAYKRQELMGISRDLRQLAAEMECPVVVLSQLSRRPDYRDVHRPALSDLREMDEIVQGADVVMLLYRDRCYSKKGIGKRDECEIIVAKNKNGATGTVYATLLGRCAGITERSRTRHLIREICRNRQYISTERSRLC